MENDLMIGASIEQRCRQDSFTVDWVYDGAATEHAVCTTGCVVVLLDLGLPKKSGAVEVHIHPLRKTLDPDLIRNARGVGYMIPKTP
jgi:DNA-binding response OmpR family regulator